MVSEFLNLPDATGAIVALGCVLLTAMTFIVCTIAVQWRKARQAEVTNALKKEMLDRGMSTEDIVRILKA